MGKGRCGAVQRLRQGELEAGVGEVVLAADDVADAEVEVVDDRGEEVGGGAVLAADDGVAEGRELDLDGAADQVGEGDRAVRQEEAPVRRPVGVRGARCQGGTVVAGRLAAGELGPAPGLQLLRGLEAGVDGTTGPEPLERSLVEGGALALPVLLVPTHAEPGQILADRPLEVGARALAVGVVEAEDEAARLLAGEEPVDHGRARVAQMEQPGRARGETDGWRHGVAHMAQLRGCIKGRAGVKGVPYGAWARGVGCSSGAAFFKQEQGLDGAALVVAEDRGRGRPRRAALPLGRLRLRGRLLRDGRGFVRRHSRMHRRMLLLKLAAQAALDALHRPQVGIVGRAGGRGEVLGVRGAGAGGQALAWRRR